MHIHLEINARCQGKVLIKLLLFVQDLALSQLVFSSAFWELTGCEIPPDI